MKNLKKSFKNFYFYFFAVCCCQQIPAGLAAKIGKTKNSTTPAKELTATTKHPKLQHKIKVTTSTTTSTTTTSTTEKPELEITTLPNVDLDLDGRSAFINNQYVSDAELNVQDTSSPLYELLQKQMETVLANKGGKLKLYTVNSPQIKESLDELTQKPLFAYDVAQFDDYDEEEDTSEEYTPDNCEDTQESLKDNDSNGNQQNLLNNYAQPLGDSTQLNLLQPAKPNKPYASSNYGPQTAQVTSSTYNSGQNAYIHKKPNNKATQKPLGTKTKPSSHQSSSNQNTYGQTTTSEQYTQKDQEIKDQNSNKQQQLVNQKPQEISYNTPKPSSMKPPQIQHGKPKPIHSTLNQKLQTSTFQNSASDNNQNFTNSQPTNPYVSRLPSIITNAPVNPPLPSNFLYGSTNTPALSPFSSTSSASTTAQQKRQLSFRTVASSTQYVSSPLADLMFKFSIGMAKPANSNNARNFGDNTAQIYNLINDQ